MGFMYGIFTYMNGGNVMVMLVGKYTIVPWMLWVMVQRKKKEKKGRSSSDGFSVAMAESLESLEFFEENFHLRNRT